VFASLRKAREKLFGDILYRIFDESRSDINGKEMKRLSPRHHQNIYAHRRVTGSGVVRRRPSPVFWERNASLSRIYYNSSKTARSFICSYLQEQDFCLSLSV